ncbi:MAG: LptE family protein [Bacteroidota bacterium]|nr:LptE family protein [Bacteroidota bacterium]
MKLISSARIGAICFFWCSCGIYSFQGISIPPDVQSVSVQYIENNADLVNPILSQIITERLKDKFIQETNLNLVSEKGDFAFSGVITEYTVAPVTAEQDAQTTLNSLTIAVQLKMTCEKHEELSFDKKFSNFQNFEASANFSAEEERLVDAILENLINEIFNKAAINW